MVGAKPGGFNDAWVHALSNLTPPQHQSDSGPVHDRVVKGNELDAGALPISRHYEKDAGRYIGSGILVCKDPDTGVRNLSYQRLQLKGPNRFGASLHSRGHIWDHLQRCAARKQNLEVAIVIGVHPAINLARLIAGCTPITIATSKFCRRAAQRCKWSQMCPRECRLAPKRLGPLS